MAPRDPRSLLLANQMDDRIPSSPQTINLFENKVARRIEQEEHLISRQHQIDNVMGLNPISPQSINPVEARNLEIISNDERRRSSQDI